MKGRLQQLIWIYQVRELIKVALSYEEWLIIIAVILLALKFGYQEIRRWYFGGDSMQDRDGENFAPSKNGNQPVGSEPAVERRETEQLSSAAETEPRGDERPTPIHITNIEIHDSIISRSTILPEDEGKNGDVTSEIEDSVVHRFRVAKKPDDP